jgi:tripeptide aminopeptidase
VPICVGSRPVLKNGFVESADPKTGLGADDRAGAAVVLCTALELVERKLPHPPITFLWTVQEEIGLYGARHVRLSQLGRPRLAFNFDGGSPYKLTIGATGGYRLKITIEGIASHAGGAPEQGVSAIAIAAHAIADLDRRGWHGAIEKGKQRGTSNVGVIQGGAATNVVTDHVEIRAEARSHSTSFRRRIVREIENAFHTAAASVKNVFDDAGKAVIEGRLDYESFKLSHKEPCVLVADAAVRSIGGEPVPFVCDGGLDANWMTVHGIPTVTLGCGQLFQHTVREKLDVAAFLDACRIGLRLATGAE